MSSIGIDVGGTKLLAVRVATDGSIVDEVRRATPEDGELLVAELVGTFVELAGADRVTACGVGIAGLVDHRAGTFVWGPHVAGRDLAIRSRLQETLEVAVAVDNDANVAAMAEHRLGAGRGSRAMLLLTVGTGIGGALIWDGMVYRGLGFAGEVGHARLATGDYLCDCGRRGCWETESTGPALERMGRELIESDPAGSLANALDGEPVNGPAISAAAAAGDPQAMTLLDRVGRALGEGLASLIAILDPDRIVIGGGLGAVGDLLLDPMRRRARAAGYAAPHRELPEIVGAALGEHAGAVGAALLARDVATAA